MNEMPEMIKGYDIICFASDWDEPWGSKQRLMQILSKQNKIFYVEYPISLLHLLFYPRLVKKILQPPLMRISENILVYTPPFVLPFGFYFRVINNINHFLLFVSIRKQLRLLNFKNLILWTYLPMSVDMIGRLKEKLVIYHCAADFPHEKNSRLRRNIISSMEKELVSRANIVLAFTEQLYKKHKQNNPHTYLFRSAVNYTLFSKALQENNPEPPDIAILKKPRIGVVGYLDGKILDIKLLKYIASVYSDCSIVLIGPLFRHIKALKSLARMDNIYFLGKKEEQVLPYYIKSLDVCLIPYVINNFTKNISPLKLYEYLTLGKPVVSTNFLKSEDCKNLIHIAENKEDFLKKIEASLSENNPDIVKRRIEMARENSWEVRLETIEGILSGYYKP